MKKNNYPLVSIIIATFNSAHTLSKVLDSLRKQTLAGSRMELLVVDGGSTDDTKKIALSYGCRVLQNPKTLPAWGKYYGYGSAKGKYAMFLDSDEVLESERDIERKVAVLDSNDSVRAVTGSGYMHPKNFSFFNQYASDFGDPFTFFYYRPSRDYRLFINTIVGKYRIVYENTDHIVFDFSDRNELPIFELVAMGSVIDLAYCKKHFPDVMNNPGIIAHLFNLLVSKHSYVAIIKNDPIIHYSADTPTKYLRKITSRVVSNIFTPAKEGFMGRNEFAPRSSHYKKYLFLPYAFTIIFPFIDAIYLCVTRENVGYLVHVPLCFYTASLIVYYSGLKLLGFKPSLRSYGQAKVVS